MANSKLEAERKIRNSIGLAPGFHPGAILKAWQSPYKLRRHGG